jgi:thiol:disulfide interchange protein
MLSKIFLHTALLAIALVSSAAAFSPAGTAPTFVANKQRAPRALLQAVVDIGSESAFDATIKKAGAALVIVDYSTTWCGPCKVGTKTDSGRGTLGFSFWDHPLLTPWTASL